MADFPTAVQQRIDQLMEEDRKLEEEAPEIARRRGVLHRECGALRASVAAYEKAKGKPIGKPPVAAPRALPAGRRSPAGGADPRAFIAAWAADHGGRIDRAAVIAAAVAAGYGANRISWVLQSDPAYQRVERGVYALEAAG